MRLNGLVVASQGDMPAALVSLLSIRRVGGAPYRHLTRCTRYRPKIDDARRQRLAVAVQPVVRDKKITVKRCQRFESRSVKGHRDEMRLPDVADVCRMPNLVTVRSNFFVFH